MKIKSWVPWIASFSIVFSSIVALPLQVDASTFVEPKRLAGDTRTLTAVEISKEGWGEGSETVILARGDKFPDALAGAVLAKSYDAPILLTNSKTLSTETQAEIERLQAKNIFILGGTGAVSEEIETQLATKYTVERIEGDNRYETSANIAKYLKTNGKLLTNSAIIAYAQNYPDALAISSWAAQEGVPILLSETNYLPKETTEALADLEISKTIISGGTGVISTKVESELPDSTRYGGDNRYETAIEIIKGLGQDIDTIFVATGNDFPDALAGSALAAKQGKAILLVGNTIDPVVVKFLTTQKEKVNNIYALGGDGVVTPSTLSKLVQTLAGILEETPEQAVTNALDALKLFDEATFERYFNDGQFMNYEDPNVSQATIEEMMQLFYTKLDYKIKSSTLKGEVATVNVEIRNTDMGAIFDEYMLEMIQLGLAESVKPEDQRLSEEEILQKAEEILLGLMKREDNPLVTTTVNITLIKNGNSWIINADEDLQDAVTGGLLSALQEWSVLETE